MTVSLQLKDMKPELTQSFAQSGADPNFVNLESLRPVHYAKSRSMIALLNTNGEADLPEQSADQELEHIDTTDALPRLTTLNLKNTDLKLAHRGIRLE